MLTSIDANLYMHKPPKVFFCVSENAKNNDYWVELQANVQNKTSWFINTFLSYVTPPPVLDPHTMVQSGPAKGGEQETPHSFTLFSQATYVVFSLV